MGRAEGAPTTHGDGEAHERQHLVQRRRQHTDKTPHLGDRCHQCVQIQGPALLEVLEHRGAMGAHIHRGVDALPRYPW